MTFITIGGDVSDGGNLPNLMPERSVATRAFDLVVGDMLLMHELRRVFRTQDERFIMTFQTLSFRDMSVSLNHAEMALFAGHPSRDILSVIEAPTFYLDIPFRLDVTGGTPSDST